MDSGLHYRLRKERGAVVAFDRAAPELRRRRFNRYMPYANISSLSELPMLHVLLIPFSDITVTGQWPPWFNKFDASAILALVSIIDHLLSHFAIRNLTLGRSMGDMNASIWSMSRLGS